MCDQTSSFFVSEQERAASRGTGTAFFGSGRSLATFCFNPYNQRLPEIKRELVTTAYALSKIFPGNKDGKGDDRIARARSQLFASGLPRRECKKNKKNVTRRYGGK